MKHRALLALAGLALLATAQSADAQTFFTNRAAFQAAAGPLLTESFESTSGVLETFTFPDFSFGESNGTNDVGTAVEYPAVIGFGVTDGLNAIGYDDNGASLGTFAFGSTIRAFGFDVGASVGGLLTIGGDISTSISLLDNTPQFFGVIWAAGFDTVVLDMAGGPNVAVDFVQYSSTTTVPEPASFALLLLGGAGLLAVRRRRA